MKQRGGTAIPSNFLDLHIVDVCQLNCRHCYLNKSNRFMPLDMLRAICEDFLKTGFPLSQSRIILSGGDPLLHPGFVGVCGTVRKLNGRVTLSTNGILIPKYIHTFHKNDGIQVSVDGNEEVHDYIRGEGSYQKAVKALHLLDENGINHGVGFTLNRLNLKCVDHVIDLCIDTGSRTLNLNLYQPLYNHLEAVTFKKWLEIRGYAIKRAEKEGIYIPTSCIEKGCIAGVLGISVLPDGTYWDCSRNQMIIGNYPQKIEEALFWENIVDEKPRDQFETCCRRLRYE